MAAVLAAGPEAVLSHRAAGALWRLVPPETGPVDVTVPTSAGRRSRRALSIHRTSPFDARDITRHLNIPVTTPARTLVDLAALLPRRRLERAIDEAERLKLCDLASLQAALEANRGRPGTAALAAVLAVHRIGSTLTRSELEERFLGLCRRHTLPQPEVNVRLLDYVVDFLWRDANVVVEVDGHQGHGTRRAFQEDRTRDARLTAAGYRCPALHLRRRDPPPRCCRQPDPHGHAAGE